MADFLIEDARAETLEEVETALIRLYRSLGVMFTALDSKNVKSLTTDKTKISSENGCTCIDGAKIVMKDGNGTTRLEMGEDNGSFVFSLKNASGRTSLTLSSTGDAVFSGNIETGQDAYVGDNIYLGAGDSDAKEIRFYDGGADDSKHVRIRAEKDNLGFARLRIVSDKIVLSTLSGVENAAGQRYITSGDTGGYVTVNGVEHQVHYR